MNVFFLDLMQQKLLMVFQITQPEAYHIAINCITGCPYLQMHVGMGTCILTALIIKNNSDCNVTKKSCKILEISHLQT